jgi:hypothetical protein
VVQEDHLMYELKFKTIIITILYNNNINAITRFDNAPHARGAILKFSKFKGVNFYLGPPSDFFPKIFQWATPGNNPYITRRKNSLDFLIQ